MWTKDDLNCMKWWWWCAVVWGSALNDDDDTDAHKDDDMHSSAMQVHSTSQTKARDQSQKRRSARKI